MSWSGVGSLLAAGLVLVLLLLSPRPAHKNKAFPKSALLSTGLLVVSTLPIGLLAQARDYYAPTPAIGIPILIAAAGLRIWAKVVSLDSPVIGVW